MGNKLTYYVHEFCPENEHFMNKMFMSKIPNSGLYIIGLEQIHKVNDISMFQNLTCQKTDYIIASNEEFLSSNNIKRNLIIKENFNGKNLKFFLKRYGSVGRINDYYYFTASHKYRFFIYNSNTNTKLFDCSVSMVFKFDLFSTYNIYILEN